MEVTERGADDAQLLDGLGSLIFFSVFGSRRSAVVRNDHRILVVSS